MAKSKLIRLVFCGNMVFVAHTGVCSCLHIVIPYKQFRKFDSVQNTYCVYDYNPPWPQISSCQHISLKSTRLALENTQGWMSHDF